MFNHIFDFGLTLLWFFKGYLSSKPATTILFKVVANPLLATGLNSLILCGDVGLAANG